MSNPADEHRRVAGEFGERVAGVAQGAWDDPAPCEGWVARDVVRHLVEWLSAFVRSGSGVELGVRPSVDDDPAAAWAAHSAAVQAVLDDDRLAQTPFDEPHVGQMRLDEAIDRFYTPDVFMHTWDLARATGQDERLDPGRCAALLAEMLPLDEVLRRSGHFGPKVEVADDADVQTRLLAFIGRRP